MQDSEIRQLDRDQRVREVLKTLAPFPAGSRGAVLTTALDTNITEAETQAAKQSAATLDRQQQTEQKRVAINMLKALMRSMNQTARGIDHQLPGIADLFKMPNDSDQATVNAARGYITNATPIAAEFTNRGLPATFLTDMQAAIDAFDAAEDRQTAARANHTAATAAIAFVLKQQREIVRELDTIIHNQYRDDPATLASWDSASHIESAPQTKEEPTSPPSSPPN